MTTTVENTTITNIISKIPEELDVVCTIKEENKKVKGLMCLIGTKEELDSLTIQQIKDNFDNLSYAEVFFKEGNEKVEIGATEKAYPYVKNELETIGQITIKKTKEESKELTKKVHKILENLEKKV